MDLLFLGRGNSSNEKEGNTSAYFIENRQLFLIDCGETVFSKIMAFQLLNDVDEVHIMITHTHSDHVGSLGSLIMYCYYNVHKYVHFIFSKDVKYKNQLITLLNCFGCNSDMYDIRDEIWYDNRFRSFDSIRFMETEHVDYLDCYSILFETKNGCVFYTGDSRNMKNIDYLLNNNTILDKLYIDVTSSNFVGNVHLYVADLYHHLPKKYHHKVYCMHFNNDECIQLAKSFGFHIVSVRNKK